MTTVTTSIPDSVSLHAGDTVHLEAQVQGDGSFLVTRLQKRSITSDTPKLSLTEWVKKYAGTMKLANGETRESLRDAYLAEKFSH